MCVKFFLEPICPSDGSADPRIQQAFDEGDRSASTHRCFPRDSAAAALIITASARGDDAPSTYGTVELLRDSWGVPHVFAETDEGAMYGLGYAAAQDRGFQMHYFLRMMQGRMSEVFGVVDKKRAGGVGQNNTLEHDRVMRAFGFAAAAKEVVSNLDRETLSLLEAYSAGVNDYFANNAGSRTLSVSGNGARARALDAGRLYPVLVAFRPVLCQERSA